MAEHLRAVTLRGPALRQITIFLRRKTQKGFFMEEKTKVTAAPTIAEKCGIKYKEVAESGGRSAFCHYWIVLSDFWRVGARELCKSWKIRTSLSQSLDEE